MSVGRDEDEWYKNLNCNANDEWVFFSYICFMIKILGIVPLSDREKLAIVKNEISVEKKTAVVGW